MSKPFLSKSKYLNGIQCPKLLWYQYNAKDKLPKIDERTEARFDQGHQVGELAKKLFPDGIDVEWDVGFRDVLKQSEELLKRRSPLFEAGFMFNSTYARADVLDPVGEGQWDIIEVKMGTSVTGVNHHDVAFQRYCYQGAGAPIRRCYLMHINRDYVRQGQIDLEQLFAREDITDALDPYSNGIEDRVQQMLATIASDQCPDPDIGPHCDDPHKCILKEVCWARVWENEDHVFTLSYPGGRQWDLYGRGILRNDEIPEGFGLTGRQQIQVEACRTGRPHIDREAVAAFLDQLVYPVYFMDFETFGYSLPIPLIDNMRPYGQVPFQFSVHLMQSMDSEPTHHSWLWDGGDDPRPGFMDQLTTVLGDHGSIVVYNKAFECARLRECAAVLPEYASWVDGVVNRILDLMAPFRAFAIYYPSQHGAASLKAVLPALTDKSYDDMEISRGDEASEEFVRVTFGDVAEAERERARRGLEEYCQLDTMGMVDIVRKMGQLLRAQ